MTIAASARRQRRRWAYRVLATLTLVGLVCAGCAGTVNGTGSPGSQRPSPIPCGPTNLVEAMCTPPTSISPAPSPTATGSTTSAPSPTSSAPTTTGAPGAWVTVHSTYGFSYDVPSMWVVRTPTTVIGWEDKSGVIITLTAAATLDAAYCPGHSGYDRGDAGMALRPEATPAAAAQAVAGLAARVFTSDGGVAPQAVKITTQAMTVSGRPAVYASAAVTGVAQPDKGCGAPNARFDVISVADGSGRPVVLVVATDQGVSGAASPADITRIISSMRAG